MARIETAACIRNKHEIKIKIIVTDNGSPNAIQVIVTAASDRLIRAFEQAFGIVLGEISSPVAVA